MVALQVSWPLHFRTRSTAQLKFVFYSATRVVLKWLKAVFNDQSQRDVTLNWSTTNGCYCKCYQSQRNVTVNVISTVTFVARIWTMQSVLQREETTRFLWINAFSLEIKSNLIFQSEETTNQWVFDFAIRYEHFIFCGLNLLRLNTI